MKVMPHMILLLGFCSLTLNGVAQNDYKRLRDDMVRNQIQARGIKDQNVLNAMKKVERHLFVPDYAKHLAYADSPLLIGEGQTISQPYIVAFMTEALELSKGMKVLEIGTGSGYQAAILAEIGCEVYTIEIIELLGEKAKKILNGLGFRNIHCRVGDGYVGWEEQQPFDAIIVTCSPGSIPDPLKEQLKEGGRMIIPVGGPSVQELVLLVKRKGRLVTRSVLPVTFVPMVDPGGVRY